MNETAGTSPVRLEGELEPELSRWLWLVKWILAIPHYVVLAFLWLTLLVLTVIAFFAILFTGRYPRGIFDFNVGVLRWTWRVAFYSYAALGTDRYPPFTLDDVPEYPARLEIPYPEGLSRGLVLVKWWLLAIPHYILLGVFLGSSGYVASRSEVWGWGLQGGLIGLLVIFAALALLFLNRYPGGLFDFVLGLDRWVARVGAYVLLMRDEYPPFRLDQGGSEKDAPPAGPAPEESGALGVVDVPEAPLPGAPQPASAGAGRGTASRVVLVVVGVIVGIVAFGLLAGGCTLVVLDQTQRDDDGFLMSPSQELSSPTYAIVSKSADIDTGGGEWALDAFLGTVRVTSDSGERPVFVGIGPAEDVDRYLDGVEHDVVSDLDTTGDPEYRRVPGGAPTDPPFRALGAETLRETFWVDSFGGAGEQSLDWEPEDGDWRIVLMNLDASRGVSSDMSIGAELDSVLWVGIGMLVCGGVLAALAALAITAGARRRPA
jgi:hypothetical protein